MAGFLYFIDGEQRPPTAEKIKQWGLAYAFTRSPEHRAVNHHSPSGKSGSVIADPDRMPGKVAGYHQDQQTWRKLPKVDGRPECWVGYWTDDPPTPDCLSRPTMLRGPVLTLGEKHRWQIPIVRRYDESSGEWETQLPSVMDIDENGKVVRGRTVERYAHLWDVTAPLAQTKFAVESGEEGAELSEQQVIDAASALIQANYVVGLTELAAIEALFESDLATIALVACRYQELVGWIEELQKKSKPPSDQSGLTIDAGAAA